MKQNAMIITEKVAADFLTTPDTRNLLAPFISRETPMAEAAKELRLELNTLHRRVGQMLDFGLLEVTREEVRDGHRVKLYQATHTEFIVPLEATTQIDLESFLGKRFEGVATILSGGVARAMQRDHPHWGFKIHVEEGYGLLQRAVPIGTNAPEYRSGEKTFWYGDSWLSLSDGEAKAFRQELETLYNKYRSAPRSETRKGHFFFAALTPC